MNPVGGFAFRDQRAAEDSVAAQRAARVAFLDELRQLNQTLDSLSLHRAILAQEELLRRS